MDGQTMAGELTIAAIGAGAAIVGGLVTGAYGHARDHFRRPILRIDYDDNSEANKITVKYNRHGQEVEEVIIRARITNQGKTPARKCIVYLTSVAELINNKESSTNYFDSNQLPWPGWKWE